MPCLIPDILFDIGKQLVENGDSKAVFKFAISGKEPFKAMKKVFASVKIINIYWNYVSVGWKISCCKFSFAYNKPPMKSLLYQIGNSVKTLHIGHCDFPIYQPILDKIVARKQLIAFSASCKLLHLDNFIQKTLPVFSSTLKDVTLPIKLMTSTFRDTFQLKSLTALGPDDDNLVEFCCKTVSLEINYHSLHNLIRIPPHPNSSSFISSSIKQLIINGSFLSFQDLNEIMNNFDSLEILKYSVVVRFNYTFSFINEIHNFTNFTNSSTKVPSKAICSFTIIRSWGQDILDAYKLICSGFEYDQTISDFYCFRKIIQSAANESTNFEVEFHENEK